MTRNHETTVEGLGQVFLADEARIAFSAPARPSEHIVGIEIKSRLTGPEPVHVSFNDGFNAFHRRPLFTLTFIEQLGFVFTPIRLLQTGSPAITRTVSDSSLIH